MLPHSFRNQQPCSLSPPSVLYWQSFFCRWRSPKIARLLIPYVIPPSHLCVDSLLLTHFVQETLRGLIDEAELIAKAETIQSFAYGFPEGNRLIGTPALELSMQWIWDTLDELDYFDLSHQDFIADWELGPTKA